jgi:hypothetical protein
VRSGGSGNGELGAFLALSRRHEQEAEVEQEVSHLGRRDQLATLQFDQSGIHHGDGFVHGGDINPVALRLWDPWLSHGVTIASRERRHPSGRQLHDIPFQ